VATGLDWREGDEVIITDEEHPSGVLPWMNLAKRHGVVVRLLRLGPDAGGILERLDALIGPRTRLVFVSHVTSVSGLRLPAADICRLAHGKGVPVMLDGAHAVGQLPVDVETLGCDFYTASGHKWLLGPQGTGFLFVRRDRLEELQVTWLDWGMTAAYDLAGLTFEPFPDARKFEFGTRDWGLYAGLAEGIRFANRTGIQGIEARNLKLAAQMKRRVDDISGLKVTTPMEPEWSAGLVAFGAAGLRHPSPGKWL
jgi:L-cysteine/cystine lyase